MKKIDDAEYDWNQGMLFCINQTRLGEAQSQSEWVVGFYRQGRTLMKPDSTNLLGACYCNQCTMRKNGH